MTMPAVPLDSQSPPFSHVPVMPEEVVRALDPRPGGVYLDVTVGGGGHSAALFAACPAIRVVAIDRDPAAVDAARERLAEYGERASVAHASFEDIEALLGEMGLSGVDGLVADLGVSSHQLGDASRGMSFRQEGPLDMRMDRSQGESALELIHRANQDELADLIYELGEERRSRRIARCIKQAAAARELKTTLDLRRAVVRAVGPHRVGGIDPATRTFQALRMAVNAELPQLGILLALAPRVVRADAVAAIISFHSLEDRAVKRAFADHPLWERLTNKPLYASPVEQAGNPRARSAKLRAARRLGPESAEAG